MLPEDAPTELLERMAAALRERGAEPLLEAPILDSIGDVGGGKVFEETLCPACEHLAPYEWWWPEDG